MAKEKMPKPPFNYQIYHSDNSWEEPESTTKIDFIKFVSGYDWEKAVDDYLRIGNKGYLCNPPAITLGVSDNTVSYVRGATLEIFKMRAESDGFGTIFSMTEIPPPQYNMGSKPLKVKHGEWLAQDITEVTKLITFLFDLKFDSLGRYDNKPSPDHLYYCRKMPFPWPKYHRFVKDFDYEGEMGRVFDERTTRNRSEVLASDLEEYGESLFVDREHYAEELAKTYFAEPHFYTLEGGELSEQFPCPIEPNYEIKQLNSMDWRVWEAQYQGYKDKWDEAVMKWAIEFPVEFGPKGIKGPEEGEIEDIIHQKMSLAASAAYNKPADEIKIGDKPDWDNIENEFSGHYPSEPPNISVFHKNPIIYNLQSEWCETNEDLNEDVWGPAFHMCKPAFKIGGGQINNMIFNNYKDKFMVTAVIEDRTNGNELNITEESVQTFYNLTVKEVVELWEAFYRLDWNFIIKYNERADERLLNLLWDGA